jgi:hypothetical protein
MTWDPVPFAVGGGAQHSPEVFRALAFAATGGGEGVVLPGDLKVVPLATPGAGVQVSSGVAYITSRAANQQGQTYVPRNPTSDTVAVPQTGSSGGVSRLVVARVEDPWVAGEPWDDPADPTVGPYVFSRLIDCPAGTRKLQAVAGHANDTGYAFARIDQPANTATITAAMITDLRQLAKPRTKTVTVRGVLTAQTVTLSDTAWVNFPSGGIPGVEIPEWATHMSGRVSSTYGAVSGSPYFNARAHMSASSMVTDTLFSEPTFDATSVPVTGQFRNPFELPANGDFPVPARLRGTTQQFMTRVSAASSSAAGAQIKTNPGDYFYLDVTFTEKVS